MAAALTLWEVGGLALLLVGLLIIMVAVLW